MNPAMAAGALGGLVVIVGRGREQACAGKFKWALDVGRQSDGSQTQQGLEIWNRIVPSYSSYAIQ